VHSSSGLVVVVALFGLPGDGRVRVTTYNVGGRDCE